MEGLELGVGDTITVYKANMIIPQIEENLTRSGVKDIPEECPVCGGRTEIRKVNDVKSLYCTNPDCQAKKIKSFTLFVSRDALNIDGLSEATLEKFIRAGFIHEYADIFHLEEHREAIVEMEGLGQKSYDNLIASIKTASIPPFPGWCTAWESRESAWLTQRCCAASLGMILRKCAMPVRKSWWRWMVSAVFWPRPGWITLL